MSSESASNPTTTTSSGAAAQPAPVAAAAAAAAASASLPRHVTPVRIGSKPILVSAAAAAASSSSSSPAQFAPDQQRIILPPSTSSLSSSNQVVIIRPGTGNSASISGGGSFVQSPVKVVGSPLKAIPLGSTAVPFVPVQQIVINAQQLTVEQRQLLQQRSQTLASKLTTRTLPATVPVTAWQQNNPRFAVASTQGKTIVSALKTTTTTAAAATQIKGLVQIQPKPPHFITVQQPQAVHQLSGASTQGRTVVNLSSSGISQISNAGGFQPIGFSASDTKSFPADSPTPIKTRKKCNCSRSQCLKLYCECFANGEFCDQDCNCQNCHNTLNHEEARTQAIKACLNRNALAFHPKIGKSRVKDHQGGRSHIRGCNCKRSGCLKNYCECYEAKVLCTSLCHCVGCKNYEESPERKTLMHLADAAVVRKEQQQSAKVHLTSHIDSVPVQISGASAHERLPFSFLTSDVIEATCKCMIDKASEAENEFDGEAAVLREFSHCLTQIVNASQKARNQSE